MSGALLAELRYARRSLLRTPAATAAAVGCLAGAIAAATGIFAVVNGVVLRGLPFQHATRLVSIWGVDPNRDTVLRGFSWPDVQDVARSARTVDAVAAMANAGGGMTLTGTGEPVQIPSRTVSGNFFETLGVAAALGRTLSPDDDVPGSPNAVVIADALWRQQFGADRSVAGRSIVLDGRPFTIVGVAPRWFTYPPRAQMWVTVAHAEPDLLANRSVGWLEIIGRLQAAATPATARADLAPMLDAIARTYHPSRGKEDISVTPLQHELLGDLRPAMWALLGGVLVLLGIACANVGGLLLVRGAARSHDIAVRLALGADARDVLRQVLAEAVVLVIAGAGVGTALAFAVVAAATQVLPADVAAPGSIGIDVSVLAFSVGVTAVAVVVCGVLPGLEAISTPVLTALQQSGRSVTVDRPGPRRALAAVEVALAVVLMVCSALVGRTFMRLRAVDVGFAADRLLAFEVPLSASRYPTADAAVRFSERLLPRLEQLPAVRSAAAVLVRPLWGTVGMDWPVTIEGQPPADAAHNPLTNLEAVSSGYFRTLGIPMIAGRTIRDDDRNDRPGVAVVSRSFAEHFWPGRDAIGRRLRFPLPGSPHDREWFTVVGVVGDAKYRGLRGTRLDLYIPAAQCPYPVHQFVVRADTQPASLAGAIRAEVQRIDRDAPIDDVVVLSDEVDRQLANPRATATIFTVFAATASILTALGLGTLIASQVRRRTREIGIRVALGATRPHVIGLMMREGAVVVATGVAAGLAIALWTTRLLSSLLYGVAPHDPPMLMIAAALSATVGLVAVWVPALRATRVDPLVALRDD
jgi:putative ABC transport system permease protein